MSRRYAARRDSNEQSIIAILRAMGCSVEPLDKRGVPDLLVFVPLGDYQNEGTHVLIEVKEPKGKLTPEQEDWHAKWGGKIEIVRSPENARAIVDRIRLGTNAPKYPYQKPLVMGLRLKLNRQKACIRA